MAVGSGLGVGSPPEPTLPGEPKSCATMRKAMTTMAAAPKPKVTNLFMIGVLNGNRRSRSCGVLLAASKTASIRWGGVVSEPALSHSAVVVSKSRSLFMPIAPV